MIPVPIPDHLVTDHTRRVVFGPPDGDPTGDVRPAEALVGIVDGLPRLCFLVQLEDGEIERISETGAIWLTMTTNQPPPFAMHVADDGDYAQAGYVACPSCRMPVDEHHSCSKG